MDEPWAFLPGTACTIETSICVGNGSQEAPEYWAICYQHPDLGRRWLHWTSDIVVRQLPELLDFRLRIRYQGRDSSLPTDQPPPHRVPGLIPKLLNGQAEWLCLAGNDPLASGPVPLQPTSLDIFLERLFAQERQIPFLLVNPSSQGEWPVNAQEWGEALAGVAKVWQVQDGETRELLAQRLPQDYACFPGAIRIYLPGARPGHDARRHQFIPASRLWTPSGREQALEDVVRMLARRSWEYADRRQIQDISQLRGLRREQELSRYKQELEQNVRQALPLAQDPEYVRLLEQEVEDLQSRLEEEQRRSLELQNRAAQLEYQGKGEETGLDTKLQNPGSLLQKLPENLIEMMELLQALYPDRIVFTERAWKSAKVAEFNRSRRLSDGWRLLWHMANTLHELYFQRERVNLETEFQRLSGFALNLTEGRMTRSDRKLMALREDRWNGRQIQIEPHVKLGNEAPNLLRVYYSSLPAERLLVIGHVGDHLANRTTMTKF